MLKVVVIGLGRFGATVAADLTRRGAEVLAVDRNVRLVEENVDRVTVAVGFDAADRPNLEAYDVGDMDVAIVAVGTNFEASVLVTTAALYRRDIAPMRGDLPFLRVALISEGDAPAGCAPLEPALRAAHPDYTTARTRPDDPALIHFTFGTTGAPKAVVHAHEVVVALAASGRAALDLRPGDIYWCTADPGWASGVAYGMIAPLANGATVILDEREFDAARCLDVLEAEGVQVWCASPSAIHMLMRSGADVARRNLSALRFAASVGEPLDAAAVEWGRRALLRPFHDAWWQTETGAIMIANTASMDVKPGSMGKPLPGVEAAILERREGAPRLLDDPLAVGELAFRAGWPSMMRGYLCDPERYASRFDEGWYLTGDLAMRDADGYFWYAGRVEDAAGGAGGPFGPLDVESALAAHPAVAEAGVVGVPDESAGEALTAFVSLRPGQEASEPLERELRAHVRKRLGAAFAPREVVFRDELPRTLSGEIMRDLLKAGELGLPERGLPRRAYEEP